MPIEGPGFTMSNGSAKGKSKDFNDLLDGVLDGALKKAEAFLDDDENIDMTGKVLGTMASPYMAARAVQKAWQTVSPDRNPSYKEAVRVVHAVSWLALTAARSAKLGVRQADDLHEATEKMRAASKVRTKAKSAP